MKIVCEIQHMASSEVLGLLSPDTLTRIKGAGDANPLFKVFSIGHEGSVGGNIVGMGNVQIQYFREAIKKIFDKLAHGTKCFLGHGETNDSTGRVPIGEVVAKKMEEIGGVLHDIAVVYIYPDHKNTVLDVASIETTVGISSDGSGGAYVSDVGPVTAVALGDGTKDKPGFPGATLLAQLQAFEKGQGQMTLAEIKKALTDGGYGPSDVFSSDNLAADKNVRVLIESATEDERKATERVTKQLATAKEFLVTELAARDTQITTLNTQIVQHKALPMLDEVLGEMKLADPMAKAIRHRAKDMKIEGDDKTLKDNVKRYVEQEIEAVKPLAEAFGYKVPTDRSAPPNDGPQNTPTPDPTENFMDPKNNPLIPAVS